MVSILPIQAPWFCTECTMARIPGYEWIPAFAGMEME
jgi:hypothetical protein